MDFKPSAQKTAVTGYNIKTHGRKKCGNGEENLNQSKALLRQNILYKLSTGKKRRISSRVTNVSYVT